MMTIIRLLDKVYWLYCKLVLMHKKSFAQLSLEIIIIVLLFACYVPRDTQYSTLKSEIVTVKESNDSVNYLLNMLKKKDSVNIAQLRHRPSMLPILSKNIYAVSTRFGVVNYPIYGMKRFHNGIDLAAAKGTPVYATADGTIKIAEYNDGFGNIVIIDHENGYETFYGHLNSIKVCKGQMILRGDTIGTVGSTGISTGYHLHYTVMYKNKPLNPFLFF